MQTAKSMVEETRQLLLKAVASEYQSQGEEA